MPGNANLIRKFSSYKKGGLITADEFCIISQNLLDGGATPGWISKLENACSLAHTGQIEMEDFYQIKRQLLSSNSGAGSNTHCKSAMPVPLAKQTASKIHGSNADYTRREEASNIVRNCTIAACLIGLLPLPVADAPFLIITQFIMLKKLCGKYGRSPGASLILIILSALLGPIVFGAFAKLIPVAGSIIGACVAGGFTWYIGSKVKGMLENGQEFTLENFKSTPVSD